MVTARRASHVIFPPEPESVGRARAFVTGLLESAGHATAIDVVTLLVSEIATNAVRHARSSFALTTLVNGSTIRIEVADGADAVPTVREPDELAVGGRGMMLVELLSERWGVEDRVEGKVVWFEISPT